ncbi:hypothetical protein LCGC14_2794930, partial [marine sediment metagenome]
RSRAEGSPPSAAALACRLGQRVALCSIIRQTMLLTIDVGNTQTHVGAFRGAELVEHWRFSSDHEATSDELAAAVKDLLALREIGFSDIDSEAISSVVPQLIPEYRHLFERYLGHEALIVGPGTKTGMPIRVDNPRELGADRLVNALAGYEQCKDACVIVDFGRLTVCHLRSPTMSYRLRASTSGESSRLASRSRSRHLPRAPPGSRRSISRSRAR